MTDTTTPCGNGPKNEAFYYEKNLLFCWLLGQKRFRVAHFALIIFNWYIYAFILCWIEDLVLINGDGVGLVDDLVTWGSICMDLLMITALLHAFRKLEVLFRRLPEMTLEQESGPRETDRLRIMTTDCSRIRDFVSLRDRASWKWYASCLGLMAVLVFVLQIVLPWLQEEEQLHWAFTPNHPRASWLVYGYATAWTAFHFVIVVGNVLWYLLSTGFTVFPLIHRYAKDDQLSVIPVAPDGKGGMSPVGDFAFALTLVAGTGMVFVAAWIISPGINLGFAIGVGFYSILLVAVFFFPLLSVHKAMRDSKEEELQWWAQRFRAEYSQLVSGDCDDAKIESRASDSQLTQSMEHLSRIDQLYGRVESMPVWPFNFATLTKFFSLIVIPLLVFVLQFLTQKLLE